MFKTNTLDIPPTPQTLNEAANIIHLFNGVSELRGETPEILEKQLQDNADRVFSVCRTYFDCTAIKFSCFFSDKTNS